MWLRSPDGNIFTMDLIRHFRTLFAWDAWANRETVRSLDAAAVAADAALVRLLAHVAAAERLWLHRILGDTEPVVVWPDLGLSEAAAALAEMEVRWTGWLAQLNPGELARPVSYVNSKGERWTSRVEEILTHVTVHSHYHRGQIAARVRALGGQPAYTDFMHAVRTHALTIEEVPSD